MMHEQKSKFDDGFIINEYEKFIDFLKTCSIKEELKKS